MHGWHGRYRRVDLATGRTEDVSIPLDILRRVLGGSGLGAWLLWREAPRGVDPQAPEAPLIFAFSPLAGTPFMTSAKFAVVAKSPLTGFISDALSSSDLALAGKRMGIDALVFTGRCARPSVFVKDRLVETDLWGRSAAEAERQLAAAGRVAAIGVAGERGVRFATISNDGRHAGRGGLGAVMGSKLLKALVLDGDVPTSLHEAPRVEELAADLSRRSLGPATAKYRELGTAANLVAFNRLAALPARNFQAATAPGVEQLAPEALAEARGRTRKSCASCAIGCEQIYGRRGGGAIRVEYENLFALGPLCGIADPEVVLEASALCDELGIDTISAGGTVAFAMECGERGLLDGAPRFGDGAGLLAALGAIGRREGALGALLAEGSRRAALAIGGGAIDFAAQVKGLEMPGYEPRAMQHLALGLAVGARGADHNRSGAYEADFSDACDRLAGSESTAHLAVESEDRAALLDSAILCKFVRGVFRDLFAETAELLRAVTGADFDAARLRAAAARIVLLKKAFNVREGWTPADDTLPERFLTRPLATGAAAGASLTRARLAAMIKGYNRARGLADDGYLPDALARSLAAELDLDRDRG